MPATSAQALLVRAESLVGVATAMVPLLRPRRCRTRRRVQRGRSLGRAARLQGGPAPQATQVPNPPQKAEGGKGGGPAPQATQVPNPPQGPKNP